MQISFFKKFIKKKKILKIRFFEIFCCSNLKTHLKPHSFFPIVKLVNINIAVLLGSSWNMLTLRIFYPSTKKNSMAHFFPKIGKCDHSEVLIMHLHNYFVHLVWLTGAYQNLPKTVTYQYLLKPIPTKYLSLPIPTKAGIYQYLPKAGIYQYGRPEGVLGGG